MRFCRMCGKAPLTLKSAKGHSFTYKGEKVTLKDDIKFLFCPKCGSIAYSARYTDLSRLDDALEKEYQWKKS